MIDVHSGKRRNSLLVAREMTNENLLVAAGHVLLSESDSMSRDILRRNGF